MNNKLLQLAVEKVIGRSTQMYSFHHIGGGEINQSYKVITNQGVFFLKVHDLDRYPKMFEKENYALQVLAKTQTVEVTKCVGICVEEGQEFMFLEYIESAPMQANFWSLLGENLASMHTQTSRYFGFQEDNYLGSIIQLNNRISNWGQFYIKNRLLPNVRKANENQFLDAAHLRKFEKYFKIVEVLFPEEEPALVHGNLWKEHVMAGGNGNPVLCNPSAYFGHREMDIALTRSVGTFNKEFYEAYHSTYPLQEDWEVRVDFCLMYYALVNLNTYGIPYLPSVEDKLNKWVK